MVKNLSKEGRTRISLNFLFLTFQSGLLMKFKQQPKELQDPLNGEEKDVELLSADKLENFFPCLPSFVKLSKKFVKVEEK
jgi:hypothetical protein